MRNAERMFSRQCAEEDLSPGSTGNAGMTIWSSKVKQEIRTDIPEATLQEATYCKLGGQLQSIDKTRTDISATTLHEATYCKLGGQLQSSTF